MSRSKLLGTAAAFDAAADDYDDNDMETAGGFNFDDLMREKVQKDSTRPPDAPHAQH